MKKVLVLGASGSIGRNTIEIIRAFPDRFSLAGFTVGKNTPPLKPSKKNFPKRLALSPRSKNLKRSFILLSCGAMRTLR